MNDRVADNFAPLDLTESESLLIGTGFGIVTDIETAPNGNLYVVSLDKGAITVIYTALVLRHASRTNPAPDYFVQLIVNFKNTLQLKHPI